MPSTTLVRVRLLSLLLLLGLWAARGREAAAGGVHYDVLVTSQSGTIVIGGFSHADLTAFAPLRVFKGESLGVGPDDPYLSDEEPGLEAASQGYLNGPAMTPSGTYSALPASAAVNFTFQPIAIGGTTRNLFFWDGSGAVNFTALTGTDSLSLIKAGFGGWTRTITGTSARVVTGATIDTTDGAGEIHKHLTTRIASGGAGPATGFYLFAMQFQVAGLAPSADAYFVYGAYDTVNPPELVAFEAAHEEALHWVEDNIDNLVPVPEPATWLLAACSVATIAAVRRLRRREGAVAPANLGTPGLSSRRSLGIGWRCGTGRPLSGAAPASHGIGPDEGIAEPLRLTPAVGRVIQRLCRDSVPGAACRRPATAGDSPSSNCSS